MVNSTVPRAFSGANYSKNAAKAGDRQPCVVCGTPITVPNPFYVRVDTSNRIHSPSVDLAGEDFGCFPIGADCLRNNPHMRELAEHI